MLMLEDLSLLAVSSRSDAHLLEQRAQLPHCLLLELPHKQGAVRVRCYGVHQRGLLAGDDVIVRALVPPVVQDHWAPLRAAWQQRLLSACLRLCNEHLMLHARLAEPLRCSAGQQSRR